MKKRTLLRYGLSLVLLGLVPVIWWQTAVPWNAAIAGHYTFPRALAALLVTGLALIAVYVLLGRKPTAYKIQSVLLLLATVAAVLFAIEAPAIFFGFDYRRVLRTGGPDAGVGLNRPDPVLIRTRWPNSAFAGKVSGSFEYLGIPNPLQYPVDVRYDSNGFRNDRHIETAEIAVLGDSFVESVRVSTPETLVRQLERRLDRTAVNLGLSGYGPQQALEVLRRFALPLSPRLVVWVLFGGNDLKDAEDYEAKRRRWNDPPAEPTVVERLFLRNALVLAGDFAMAAYRNALERPSAQALNQSALFRRSDGGIDRVYFGGMSALRRPGWQIVRRTLREANRLSRQNGAAFVVVYVPRKFRVYRHSLEFEAEREIASWTVNDLPDRMRAWCAAEGIGFVDTTPVLAAAAARGEHTYFVDDAHWNAHGQRIAAEAIAGYVAARGLLRERR